MLDMLWFLTCFCRDHYSEVIMGPIASQITSLTIVYSTVYSDADQRKHQSSASLAFVRGIHRWPVNSPHKGPVTRKMFPFDDVIMYFCFSLVPDRYDAITGAGLLIDSHVNEDCFPELIRIVKPGISQSLTITIINVEHGCLLLLGWI